MAPKPRGGGANRSSPSQSSDRAMVKEKEEKPKDKEQLPLEKEGAWLDDLVALLDRSVRANDYKQIVKVADQSILPHSSTCKR
jgi:hypothetical protein